MSKAVFWSLFPAILILALGLRTARLDFRPMHHDEANQAVKFGTLLERGEYRYDPDDHHGPSLYYLTLPAAWLCGQKTLADLDERTLRLVPALFGAGLICLFVPLAKVIGRESVLLAGLFSAVSPAAAYFSRFYIHESLFVFFALGFAMALGHYAVRPSASRALAAGLFAGLAFATKETCIIVFAGAAAALLLERALARRIDGRRSASAAGPRASARHAAVAAAAALAVAAPLYSSFFSHWAGIPDSIRAFGGYAARGFEAGLHSHPWHYYVGLLAFSSSGGLIWTEGLVLVLACAGSFFAFRGRPARNAAVPGSGVTLFDAFWPRYLTLYSWLVAAGFSVIRLKTPWNLLPFYAGLLVLAGFGGVRLIRMWKSRIVRILFAAAVLAGACHLGAQSWTANFVYPADPRNPYVYSQTVPDFLRLVKRIHDLAAVHPYGREALIKVVAGPYEQWPLPWYLRDMSRVGYWTDPSGMGGMEGVAMVVASQDNISRLENLPGDRFQQEFYGLRPEVLLSLYVDRGLWNRFLLQRSR